MNCELTSLTSIEGCSRAGTLSLHTFEQEQHSCSYVLRKGMLALQHSRHFGASDSTETVRQDELRKRFSEYAEFPGGPKLPLPLDIPVLKSFQLRGKGHLTPDHRICP